MTTIIIRPGAVGFVVTTEPAPAWSLPVQHERPDRRSAQRCADSLRVVHGWPIRDETPAGEGGVK